MLNSRYTRIAFILPLLFAAACNRDPQAEAHRLVGNGNKFYDKSKFKEASILYRRALSKYPKDADAYYRLGLAFIRLGNLGDATRALRRATDLQPNNTDAATKLADIYWLHFTADNKRYKNLIPEIKDLSEALIKRDRNSFDGLRLGGYLRLAEAEDARQQGHKEEVDKKLAAAIEQFQLANRAKPDNPQLSFALVSTLKAAGRRDEAEMLAKEVIGRQKNFGPMYDALTAIYVETNRPAEAEKVLIAKVQNNPSQEIARLQLAAVYLATHRRPEMEKVLQDLTANKKDFPMARLSVGRFFARAGDPERARRELEAGAAEGKSKLEYQKALVELLTSQGKYAEAAALVNVVLKEDPKDTAALELRSALGIQSGDRQQINTAANDLQSLVTTSPANAILRLQLGRALMAKNQPEQARIQLEESLRLRPTLNAAKILLAQIYSGKHEYARALALTAEVLSQPEEQGNMPARLIRTSALLGTGERKRAKEELESMLKANPGSADAKFQLGYVNFTEGNYKEAGQLFQDLRKSNPLDRRGLTGVLETQVAEKNYQFAIDLVNSELSKDPNREDLRVQLGNVLARAGMLDEAIRQFQALISRNPKEPDYEMKLAETYRMKGDLENSIQHFRKASTLAPNDTASLMRLGMMLDGVGRRQEAKPVYEQIIRLQPDNVIALNNLAFIKAEEGVDLDQALSYAQRAKQRYPQNSDVSDTLGWIYIKKNLSDDAVRVFRELVVQKPGNSTYRYHLAMALFQKGDRPNAKVECQAALKNNPSKDEQNKIKELLGKIS